MVERVQFVEALGFDWVSVSEHHYSPRILTPSPVVSAAWLAARVDTIKIALLGPIVPVSNPIRVAEELAMLDTLAPGRIVVGLLRGTTNEYLSYDLNPQEARERTDEGMELILKAWTEPQPFGWQGRHFQYRTVSIWPRPQDPHAADLRARHQRARRASSPRATTSASACPTARSRSWRRPRDYYREQLRALWLGAGPGRHHLPRQHDPGRNRRCGGGRAAPARQAGAVPGAAGGCAMRCWTRTSRATSPASGEPSRSAACCRSASAAARTAWSSRSAAAASRSAPACSTCRCTDPGTGDARRDDGGARTVRQQGPAAHPRHLRGRVGTRRSAKASSRRTGSASAIMAGRARDAAGPSARRRRPAPDARARPAEPAHRVIVFEMPGFGQSAENTRTRTTRELGATMGAAIGHSASTGSI